MREATVITKSPITTTEIDPSSEPNVLRRLLEVVRGVLNFPAK